MKAAPIVLCAVLCGFSEVPAPHASDAEKLKIREAELALSEATAARNAAESAYYRAVQIVTQQQTAVQSALSEVGKRLNCEIDAQTADCKAKPASPKK